MATSNEMREFVKTLSIRQVAEQVGGVSFTGTAAHSPFRVSHGRAFTIDERRNIFCDWGYPVDDNPRGVAAGDPIDFVRYLMNLSYKDAVEFLWNYYHGATPAVRQKKEEEQPSLPSFPDLSPDQLDKAYEIFLSYCQLSDKGRKYLHDRGITDEEIEKRGFKTFPNISCSRELTMKLIENGINPAAVPGLYIKKGAEIATFKKRDALIIPVRDVQERIEGLQLRFFNPVENGPKYVWFSSAGMIQSDIEYEGKSPGCPIGYIPSDNAGFKSLFITEGMFKAMSVNKAFQCPVFTVQGVGNFSGIENRMEQVLQIQKKINRVLIAYDADFICNMNVAYHAVRLYETLKSKYPDFTFGYVIWDKADGKGFDDLIENVGVENVAKHVQVIPMAVFKDVCEEVRSKCKSFFENDQKEIIEKEFKNALLRKTK